MENDVIIEVRELTKKYGKLTVLDNLSFNIFRGEIFGLLGPNGAGKSTFISTLATICKPTSGDMAVSGFSIKNQPERIRRSIGLVPQDIALYPALTGMDNLDFWASIYGLRGSLKKERIYEALSVVRLEDRAADRVENYSGGMKRRLNIAVALVHHPEILVMDEPTVGVDIQSRRFILDAVKALKNEGKTVIFTSHYIDEMEALCDRLALLDRGIIKSIGTVNELLSLHGSENMEEIMLKLFEG